jgi:putative transposase
MAQSLAQVYLHLIFSTKQRQAYIDKKFGKELHAYLATTLKSLAATPIAIGGMPDHVHVLCVLPKTFSIS